MIHKKRPPFQKSRKNCPLCEGRVGYIDYKDADTLRAYLGDRGKIIPGRASGVCAKHQRKLTSAVKKARIVALLPFVTD
jgi:small subunit ribosomal protein S18